MFEIKFDFTEVKNTKRNDLKINYLNCLLSYSKINNFLKKILIYIKIKLHSLIALFLFAWLKL